MAETWKRYFSPASSSLLNRAQHEQVTYYNRTPNVASKFSSHLPEVYSGAPNRIERYTQYEAMDLDSHVSASLDIIAEFCTQTDESTGMPFHLKWKNEPTNTESEIVANYLKKWITINDFDNKLFDLVRGVIKYGDQFFVRDPETLQWLHVYHSNVEKVVVNESEGKKPEQYTIRDLDYNMQALSVTPIPVEHGGTMPSSPGYTYNNVSQNTRMGGGQSVPQSRFSKGQYSSNVNAEHVIHVSMNTGLDPNWPFGTSILERIFKTFKQKELVEDSVLIYRIQRAPERRVFYIDVGDLPQQKAMAFVEQMKNSIHQRRIPSKTGGGTNIMDAAYSPLSVLEDYFFPQRPDGRGSKIETLPGGETSWGVDELLYFDNKLARGLRVPSSYLPTGPEDSNAPYNDGKLGVALIQEFRFAEHCKRIQNVIAKKFDEEFKLYLKRNDIQISAALFDLKFNPPQNFASWRQIDIDSSRIGNFTNVASIPFLSKRFAMEHYLGLTKDQILRNEQLFVEENPNKFAKTQNIDKFIGGNTNDVDLRNVGLNKSDVFADEEPGAALENPENTENAEGEEPGATAGTNAPTDTIPPVQAGAPAGPGAGTPTV